MREPYVVSLPSGVSIEGLNRAFAAERVASEDSTPFTTRSRETLLQAPAGGPYSVSLFRYVSDRYHGRPCVTLAPIQDGRSVKVSWSDATERLFWTTTIGVAVVFAITAIVFALSINLLGLVLLLPAVAMVVIGLRNYHSSSEVQRRDCEDAVKVALAAAAMPGA